MLNKPAGITSFDAVARCRRLLHEKKIGHTGTLDPNASGLLIILTGRYTKLLPYCAGDHKRYKAGFILGSRTDTEDVWGNVTGQKEPSSHTQEELDDAARLFLGRISQVPPMYSALKVNGKKLYEYARKGQEVERQAREVEISSLAVRHTEGNAYEMEAVVSSGTYIRTLITDYCEALGEYGTMNALERRAIEHLSVEEACTLEELGESGPFIDPLRVLAPGIATAETADEKALFNGRDLKLSCSSDIAAVTYGGEIRAVYRRVRDDIYHCERGIF